MNKTPRSGDIFYLEQDKPYQIITVGIHKETCESMVIYQALFGEYGTYVLPLSKFMDEVNRTAVDKKQEEIPRKEQDIKIEAAESAVGTSDISQNRVNEILLQFLDADSYSKKLEVISSNIKAIDDRLINDMAVSLDCTVDDGPIEQRVQGLVYCLKQLSRFEVKRLR